MTYKRLIMIILWILSLVGISFYGGPVSYGFFAAVTAVPVVSLLYVVLVLFRFKIYQDLDKSQVVADTVSKFYITLQNEDFFTFAGVRVLFYSPFSEVNGMDDSTEYELAPFSGIKKETSLICKYRGEYEVGIKSIVVRDYFDLFRITYRNREPFRVNVLPKIITPQALHTIDLMDTSAVETRLNATDPDILVRDHTPEDGIKMINWKVSARQGKLLVRNYIGEEKQGISIIMDSARYSDDPKIYLPIENQISECVIALTMYFIRNNTPVDVRSYSGRNISRLVKDMVDFNSFYSFISGFRFGRDNTTDKLCAGLSSDHTLYSSKLVIMALHEMGQQAQLLVSDLERNAVSSIIYLITDDASEAEKVSGFTHTKVFVIPPEADICEVL